MLEPPPDRITIHVELGMGGVQGRVPLTGRIPGQPVWSFLRQAPSLLALLAAIGSPVFIVMGALALFDLSEASGIWLTAVSLIPMAGFMALMMRLAYLPPTAFEVTPHQLRIGDWAAEASAIDLVRSTHWTTRHKRNAIHHHALEVMLRDGQVARFQMLVEDAEAVDALAETIENVLRDDAPEALPAPLVRLMAQAGRVVQ